MKSAKPKGPRSAVPREVKVYGVAACDALWRSRREDIIRAYILESAKAKWGNLLKWCAQQRKAYHLVDEAEIARVSGSLHHEGVCLLAREKQPLTEQELFQRLAKKTKSCALLFLDGVDNPHNVGAILRVCAHFAVDAVLVPANSEISLSGSTCRVAEGGAESVAVVKIANAERTVTALRKAGFQIFATSSHAKLSLFQSRLSGDALFLFGAEGEGLSAAMKRLSERTLSIPGSQNVESLNVACASSVILGEWWRQNR